MVRNAVDFIKAKGGPKAVSQATGHGAGAISVWASRNKLPRSAWPELLNAFPDITLDDLLAMEGDAAKAADPERPEAAA